MGLFDRLKKKDKVEVNTEELKATEEIKAEAAEALKEEEGNAAEEKKPEQETVTKEAVTKEVAQPETAKADTEKASESLEEDSRFTLLVEEGFQLKDDLGVVVAGILYGTVHKGDAVYVIHPNGNIMESEVESIETGLGKGAEKAHNQNVAIRLANIKDKNQLPKYTVLTGIKPQTNVDVNNPTENPQLLALTRDYPRLCKDLNYQNLFVYVACHAHYVVPASVENPAENNGDTKENDKKETLVRFPSLQNPNDKNTSVFPIFTDNVALSKWKNLFDENHPPRTMLLRFPDVVSISKGNAVVMNPFGPTPVLLDVATIQNIVNMDGYKAEFGPEAQKNAQNTPTPQENKMMVGVPKETEEIKKIKEAVIDYAKQVEAIKRIDFFVKIDNKNIKAYLCVMDCPQEQAAKISSEINGVAAPHFVDIKRMEFMLYGKSKMANDIVSDLSCIYQA